MMVGNALGVDKFGTVMKGTSFKREFPMKVWFVDECLLIDVYSNHNCFLI